jgi:FkbM family methyltransferase
MIQKDQLLAHDTFIVFGAGNTGRKVETILNSLGKKVRCFLVSNDPGQAGHSSQPPVIAMENTGQITQKDLPVIIAVFNREKNAGIPLITAQLRENGFTQIITWFEFHAIFADELGDIFWLTRPSFYRENQARIRECLSLFHEPQSRMLYNQVSTFLETFDPDLLSEPDMDHQYFLEDLNNWDGSEAFIDVGTFDGQNIIDAASKFGPLQKVFAFEPDPDNFKKINGLVIWDKVAREAVLFPCGVWSETTVLYFNSGAGESAAVSAHGDVAVPVVSLDDVLHGVVPGFIKMDIEGAEIEALNGAKNLIAAFRPSLAISIYHKPDHLFEIPLLVNSWNLGYQFHIRFHGHNLFETVLYCIPGEER